MQTPSAGRIHLSANEARDLSERALRAIGYNDSEAKIIADHVLDAALCGYEYSGLPKILNAADSKKARQPRQPMQVLRETGVSTLFDGGNNIGMLTMQHATMVAITKAQQHGFALIGVTNSWMSGRSSYYVEQVARAGLIGIHTLSSARHVAPPGGTRAMLGTNPMAFGFPAAGDPLIIDVGTAAFMSTDLSLRERLGAPLPEGVAIDEHGLPTTDPHAARRGAMLPFGGHKGYALALAMQALGVLAGSAYNADKDYGYLMMAIKPDLLVPLEEFRTGLSEELARIKATPRQPGIAEIRIPSERSFRERERNLSAGIIIDSIIHERLLQLANTTPV
jgi:LDH2 family malate/lactate/ureidoglycolate dehydrogenase